MPGLSVPLFNGMQVIRHCTHPRNETLIKPSDPSPAPGFTYGGTKVIAPVGSHVCLEDLEGLTKSRD
jgi:hypothetical protein